MGFFLFYVHLSSSLLSTHLCQPILSITPTFFSLRSFFFLFFGVWRRTGTKGDEDEQQRWIKIEMQLGRESNWKKAQIKHRLVFRKSLKMNDALNFMHNLSSLLHSWPFLFLNSSAHKNTVCFSLQKRYNDTLIFNQTRRKRPADSCTDSEGQEAVGKKDSPTHAHKHTHTKKHLQRMSERFI